MNDVVAAAAVAVAAAAVVASAGVLVVTGRIRPTLGVLLDLLLAAGLLRLAAVDSWGAVAGVVAVVLVRLTVPILPDGPGEPPH